MNEIIKEMYQNHIRHKFWRYMAVHHPQKMMMILANYTTEQELDDALDAAIDQDEYFLQSISKEQGPQNVDTFQRRVQPWMNECFGEVISGDKDERNARFIEESLELVQACGMSRQDVMLLVEYVYSRPLGDPPQEVGGVMVTLAAHCLANGLDMHVCGEVELTRIWGKVDVIREKQKTKPKNSPLPMIMTRGQYEHTKSDE